MNDTTRLRHSSGCSAHIGEQIETRSAAGGLDVECVGVGEPAPECEIARSVRTGFDQGRPAALRIRGRTIDEQDYVG